MLDAVRSERHELTDVEVLGIVGDAAQIPDDVGRVRRIGDPAGRPDVLDHRSIALLRPAPGKQAVGDQASLECFILVMMRGDEAGHYDRTRAVDDLCIGSEVGGHVGSDSRDHRPVDQDVRFFEVAHARVEAEHGAAAQQDAPFPAVADEALKIRPGRGTQAGELRGRGSSDEPGRARLEEVASQQS